MPAVLTVVAVIGYPLALAAWTSLKRFRLGEPETFTGPANYSQMLQDPIFWNALWVTARYTLFCVVMIYVLGLGVAWLLNHRFRGRTVARTFIALPWAVPGVAVSLVWAFMMDPSFGILNQVLMKLGLIAQPIQWLTSPDWSLFSVSVVNIWQVLPFMTIMLLAGMQSIPPELYESARVDGANAWQLLRHITLPGLSAISMIAIVLVTMALFREFALIYVMTGGGPQRSTETIGLRIYIEAFQNLDFGYASAMGMVALLISLIFAVGYIRFTTRGSRS
jgi:multiple sugar transport system permease protein